MFLNQTQEGSSPASLGLESLRHALTRIFGDRPFGLMWVFVGLVAVYDTHLVIRDRLVLLEAELNPIAVQLIRLNGGDVSLLVLAKTIGTLVVLCTLMRMHQCNRGRAYRVLSGIAVFQFVLLLMLTV